MFAPGHKQADTTYFTTFSPVPFFLPIHKPAREPAKHEDQVSSETISYPFAPNTWHTFIFGGKTGHGRRSSLSGSRSDLRRLPEKTGDLTYIRPKKNGDLPTRRRSLASFGPNYCSNTTLFTAEMLRRSIPLLARAGRGMQRRSHSSTTKQRQVEMGDVVWSPSPQRITSSRMVAFARLAGERSRRDLRR